MKGFDPNVMSMLLATKNAEQCRLFYNAHIPFLKKVIKIGLFRQRVKVLKEYMGINGKS